MKQRGFVLINMLILSLLASLFSMAGAVQSQINTRFVDNLWQDLIDQEHAFSLIRLAEQDIATRPIRSKSDYSVSTIAHVPNSWNYLDQGVITLYQITLTNPNSLQAIWWQRSANYSMNIQHFLAKDGRQYNVGLIKKPLGIKLSAEGSLIVLNFPKTVTAIGRPLLVSPGLPYATELIIADNLNQIWQIHLSQNSKNWQLKKILVLHKPIRLDLSLWAASSIYNVLVLYVPLQSGLAAWELDKLPKKIWQINRPVVNFFLEGKRLWWVAKAGWNKLALGAIDRLTGQVAQLPLFVTSPEQTEWDFSPESTNYNWQLQPDNLKQIEWINLAGKTIKIYSPQYESGEQSLKAV